MRVITVNSVAKVMANKTTEEKTKFDEVHIYLLKGEYPTNSSKGEKLVIRRRAKDYRIIDGQLHYIGHMKRCNEDPTKLVYS